MVAFTRQLQYRIQLLFKMESASFDNDKFITLIHNLPSLWDKRLYLSATGRAEVEWQETETTSSEGKTETYDRTYSNSEEYFNLEVSVLGAKKPDMQIEIPAGHHQYPFKFHLPPNIPSSFKHKYGYVSYTVKGVIDRPGMSDYECKAAFTVLSILDLNGHSHKCLGIDDEINNQFCCLCVIDQGSLNVRISVPLSGYVPGHTVYTTIDYKNSSDSVEITEIETKYEQRLKFHATEGAKTATCVKVSSINSGPFEAEGQIVSELLIPPLPPSYLQFCKIIDLEYMLRVIVHVSGWHTAIDKEYPMLTGTVPLYHSPTAAPLDDSNDTSTFEQTMEEPAMVRIPLLTPEEPNALFLPNNQSASSDASDEIQPTDVTYPDEPSSPTVNGEISVPSSEECMSEAEDIEDNDESNYVHEADDSPAPTSPVDSYPSPSINECLTEEAFIYSDP